MSVMVVISSNRPLLILFTCSVLVQGKQILGRTPLKLYTGFEAINIPRNQEAFLEICKPAQHFTEYCYVK